MEQLADPALAQTAVHALRLLTGLDVSAAGLEGPRRHLPRDQARALFDTPEGHEPWPDPEGVARWWQDRQSSIDVEQRYLGGRPLTVDTAVASLLFDPPALRYRAALHLACSHPHRPLFPVNAPLWRQHQLWYEHPALVKLIPGGRRYLPPTPETEP